MPLDIVLYPEVFLYNGSNAEFCGAKPPYGLHVTTCAKAAVATTNAYVVCPFYELATPNASQDAGPTYNTSVLLDRTGAVVGKYRKSYPTLQPNCPMLASLRKACCQVTWACR